MKIKTMKTKTLQLILICLLFIVSLCVGISLNTVSASATTETSDLSFTLINGGAEYKVSASNKSLTSAIIPNEYNNLPVTEIADNGFMMCRSLEKIVIPASVKRIGNNAFMNDTNLKRVMGMSSVTAYGSNAFSMCSNLDYLILPAGISQLGTNVVRNVKSTIYARASETEMNELNPNWNYDGNVIYGNKIAFAEYTAQDGTKGYEVVQWQNLSPSDEALVLYSWCYKDIEDVEGAPLLNIAEGAFSAYQTPSITIKHPDNSGLNHSINIEPYAFTYTLTQSIHIETSVTFNKKDTTYNNGEGLFYSSTATSINFKDSLEVIPKLMFADCVNLEKINYTDAKTTNNLKDVKEIENEAFKGCINIDKLEIPETIEYIDENAFNLWGTGDKYQYITIDAFDNIVDNEDKKWPQLWNNGINYENCDLEFIAETELKIDFVVEQEGVIDPIGAKTLIVQRDDVLNNLELPTPTSTSHNFTGIWYTNVLRSEGSEFSLNAKIKNNYTLYAGWEIKNFDVYFTHKDFCTIYDFKTNEIINSTTKILEYGQSYSFYIDGNEGYHDFVIYKNDNAISAVSGNVYTFEITEDVVIDIQATPTQYEINYVNLRGGTNPNEDIKYYTVESETIEFAAPEWAAYKNGIWNIQSIPTGSTGDKDIVAIWSEPVVFSIKYLNLRDGINPNESIKTYTVESNTIELTAPIWEAYLESEWDVNTIPKGTWGDLEITAIWKNPKQFRIEYANIRGGTNPNEDIKFYTVESETIEFAAPEWAAYRGRTWNRTSIQKGSCGDAVITAVWSNPETFTITYNLNDKNASYSESNPKTYTVEQDIRIAAPTSLGYTSGTWDNNGWSHDTIWRNLTINAVWSGPKAYRIYIDLNGGYGDETTVTATYGEYLPQLATPTKYDYKFKGYRSTSTNELIYDADMNSIKWEYLSSDTIVAQWEQEYFYVTFEQQNGIGVGGTSQIRIKYGDSWPKISMPTRKGYSIQGYYYLYVNSDGYKIYNSDGTFNSNNRYSKYNFNFRQNITLKCYWEIEDYYSLVFQKKHPRDVAETFDTGYIGYEDSKEVTAPETCLYTVYTEDYQNIVEKDLREFDCWKIRVEDINGNLSWIQYSKDLTIKIEISKLMAEYFPDFDYYSRNIFFWAEYSNRIGGVDGNTSCVAEDTLITLFDGSQKAVQNLKGDELLLVWNLQTGTFDTAPILFIDNDTAKVYKVINLHFSDGTNVKIISEHAFWDFNLNKYVFLREDAYKYIGHWFNKQIVTQDCEMAWTKVQLTDVFITEEYTTAWSPVTYSHLCYYVNGMLSMPGATEGLINIFDVDSTTMAYDEEAFARDIDTYGLFTYEEFAELIPVPEEVFNAFNGQYMKVAFGKGLLTEDDLLALYERYSHFFY